MERIIDLAPATWAALDAIARHDGVAVAALLREAVDRDLYRRSRAKRAARPDERLVAPLRALLADDLAFAAGWGDLNRRLRRKGYALIESGGGVALVDAPGGRRVCKGSDSRLQPRAADGAVWHPVPWPRPLPPRLGLTPGAVRP